MIFKEREFVPVLLGGDISNYSMARSFYEAYQIKSIIVGRHPIYPTTHTGLVESFYDPNIEDSTVFTLMMEKIDKKYREQKKILLGNNDNYVRLIIENRSSLSENFITPYIAQALFNRLIVKKNFYEICEQYGLDYPQTYTFECSKKADVDITLPFDFPVFVKPSDTVIYSRYVFDSKKKGYTILNKHELISVLKDICDSGYPDSLIIQEFIPGDDSAMRVLTCYSDRYGKVKGIAMGQIILEDHAPMLVGNYLAILSGYNEMPSEKFIQFLEAISYVGITHFDIKYDARNNKYKVFEQNIRQGRNNYYTTASGLNLAQCLVDDYIYRKELKLVIAQKPSVCAIVPKYIITKYIKDHELKAKIAKAEWIRPLLMKGDLSFTRLKMHALNDLKHISSYKKYNNK